MKKNIKSKVIYPILAVISLGFSGCTVTDMQAGMGILSTLAKGYTISNKQLAEQAKLSAKALDKQSKVASPRNKYTRRLNRLTKNLKSYQGLNLNYKVYLSKQINAFAMPDGTVRVYSGLMDIMNDDELMAVIGHEIGHVAHQHSLNQYKKAYISKAVQKGLSAYGGESIGALADSYGDIGLKFVGAQFSQKDELESDEFGVKLLHQLGRNPYAAASAQKKLQSLGGSGASIFSSHPPSHERIKKATAVADKITRKK